MTDKPLTEPDAVLLLLLALVLAKGAGELIVTDADLDRVLDGDRLSIERVAFCGLEATRLAVDR